jgi:hypothetical protein
MLLCHLASQFEQTAFLRNFKIVVKSSQVKKGKLRQQKPPGDRLNNNYKSSSRANADRERRGDAFAYLRAYINISIASLSSSRQRFGSAFAH